MSSIASPSVPVCWCWRWAPARGEPRRHSRCRRSGRSGPNASARSQNARRISPARATGHWDKANKDLSLTEEEKLSVIAKGIAAEDRALAVNPDYVPAITYKNIFLRMQASLSADPAATPRSSPG